MKKVLFLLMIFVGSYGRAAQGDGKNWSRQESGFFSIGLIGGYDTARLLNQDGNYSGFKGSLYGIGLEINLMGTTAPGSLSIFANATSASSKDPNLEINSIIRSETLYGLKLHMNSWLFVGLGAGQTSVKVKTSTGDQTLAASLIGLGVGAETGIGGSLYLGLEAWYKQGPIRKADNPSLSGNSSFDSGQMLIYLSWSPPSMTINYNGK